MRNCKNYRNNRIRDSMLEKIRVFLFYPQGSFLPRGHGQCERPFRVIRDGHEIGIVLEFVVRRCWVARYRRLQGLKLPFSGVDVRRIGTLFYIEFMISLYFLQCLCSV